jgi:hypothetical protein
MDEQIPSAAEPEAIEPADTELVELPAVQLAAAEPVGPRRVNGRVSVVAAIVAALAIGGVGAFGYSTSQNLAASRSTLATTEADLAAKKTTLETTTTALSARTTALSGAKADHTGLDGTIAGLSTQVAGQTKCVTLQAAGLAELSRIEQLQTENFNRTTKGTAWSKADAARGKAISAALDDYYQAYSKAFQGSTSVARTWASKGKAAEATIAAEEKKQAAEIKVVDQNAAEILDALNALEQQLAATEAACAEVTE